MSMKLVICIVVGLCLAGLASAKSLPALGDDIEEDARLSTPELIQKYGYPVEVHKVYTDDDYILEMHRIPYGRNSPAAPDKPVVFLQHGLLCSSADWVIMGTDKGFAYILADLGYDVWMGNSRGNTYSRNHKYMTPEGSKFWQFTWHEMGLYDIPAEIDYVLGKTGQQKLFYVGHSQGTTQFFVMASERPEYNDKIKAMFSLAPIAFMNHAPSPFLQFLAHFNFGLEILMEMMGIDEFLPNSEFMENIGQSLCRDTAIFQFMCENVLFLIAGFDSAQLNSTMIPVIMGHTPAGAATKQMIHYAQEVSTGDFQQYDYYLGNMFQYGQLFPPEYNLNKITCPVSLHYSENDWMAGTKDVERLYDRLANPIGKFLVPLKAFNHLDFLWAIDVKTLLYNNVISLMNHYA